MCFKHMLYLCFSLGEHEFLRLSVRTELPTLGDNRGRTHTLLHTGDIGLHYPTAYHYCVWGLGQCCFWLLLGHAAAATKMT